MKVELETACTLSIQVTYLHFDHVVCFFKSLVPYTCQHSGYVCSSDTSEL